MFYDTNLAPDQRTVTSALPASEPMSDQRSANYCRVLEKNQSSPSTYDTEATSCTPQKGKSLADRT